MLKHENQLRLARMAASDVRHGGARALVRSNRLLRMGGGYEADEIVSRIYSSSKGAGTYECRECGQEWVSTEESLTCCAT